MTPTTVLSFLISTVVMGLVAWYALWQAPRKQLANVYGYDCFALMFAKHPLTSGKPMTSTLLWMGVFVVAGVFFPLITDGTAYFETKAGLVVSFNFTILIPCLLGAYLHLLGVANTFFEPLVLRSLGLATRSKVQKKPAALGGDTAAPDVPESSKSIPRGLGRCLVRARRWAPAMLIIPALLIQHHVIRGAEAGKWPFRPWASDDGVLNLVGSLYYALRGLDGLMALGFAISMHMIAGRVLLTLRSPDPRKMYTDALRVRSEVRHLGSGLVCAFLIGSAAIAVNGLGMFLENPEKSAVPFWDRATASTWLLWAILMLSMMAMLLACLIKLHLLLARGREMILNAAIKGLGSDPGEGGSASGASRSAERRTFSDRVNHWQGTAAIVATFGHVHAWPLPRVAASAGILVSIILQSIGWYLSSLS